MPAPLKGKNKRIRMAVKEEQMKKVGSLEELRKRKRPPENCFELVPVDSIPNRYARSKGESKYRITIENFIKSEHQSVKISLSEKDNPDRIISQFRKYIKQEGFPVKVTKRDGVYMYKITEDRGD